MSFIQTISPRRTQMSKNQSTASTSKTYTFYDRDNLQKKAEKVDVPNVATFTDLQSAVNSFENLSEVLEVLTAAKQRDSYTEARRKVRAGGIPVKVLSSFIKSFRETSPFKEISDYAAQTEAILEQVRQVPFFMNALRDAATAAEASGTADNDDE